MKSADAPRFSDRVDRFLRWFLNAAPDAVVASPPPRPAKPKKRTVARRKPTGLRPKHAGPARAASKGKP
jgi:hypothetical protein